ncbi:hypothetical protein L6164_018797 [Bauhinia variegata]|uniref:Uncharacterized protein n=1 Tax=Bauhinia variegata TaxID=167791 RepID=A0ACB9NCA9_BAUVA|nr:hypothetical protein L6164_018797 [Bauhinia variegata]
MASGCSSWYLLYYAASITLAVLAITIEVHSISKKSEAAVKAITLDLSVNASRTLRLAGFNPWDLQSFYVG